MPEAIPNFFIVGAPKCGTTSMHAYLRQHPEAFVPWIKELHHFGRDLPVPRIFRDNAEYVKLFAEGAGAKVRADISPSYLYSASAPREILSFNSEARVMIMLRSPADMLYSLHSQRLFAGKEKESDFERAMERARREQDRPPSSANRSDADVMPYFQAVRFSPHVKRWMEAVPKDRLKVVLFDDLKADAGGVFRDSCRFVGIRDDVPVDLAVANANKSLRNRPLAALIRAIPPGWRYRAQNLLPQAARRRIAGGVQGMLMQKESRPKLSPATRQALAAEFADDIDALAGLLGRDLSAWKRGG